MAKYKVGDVVRLKTQEELRETEGVLQRGGEFTKDSVWFVEEMFPLCGTSVTLLESKHYDYTINVNDEDWIIEDWMIAGYADEIVKEESSKEEVETHKQTVTVSSTDQDMDKILDLIRYLVTCDFNVDIGVVGESYKINAYKIKEK